MPPNRLVTTGAISKRVFRDEPRATIGAWRYTDGIRAIAAECVSLVAAEFGRTLDWHLDSLAELDTVCELLLADGPLTGERLDLWWKLIGAYVGEVVVRAYGGRWVTHDSAPGSYAVDIHGTHGFPFAVTERVLEGEPFKSLATFGRVLPHIPHRPEP